MKQNPLGVCSLQFGALSLEELCKGLARRKWDGDRVFTVAELGAGENHFDYRGILGLDTARISASGAKDKIATTLGNNGYAPIHDGEVSAHAKIMAINGTCIHTGWKDFVGPDIWAELSNGWPNEPEIRKRGMEVGQQILAACSEMKVPRLNVFFSSRLEGYRRQFPHQSGSPPILKDPELDPKLKSFEDQLIAWDVARMEEFCKAADALNVDVCVEPHPGELLWSLERMIRVLKEAYKLTFCKKRLRLKFDPSHWKMHGFNAAAVIRRLTKEFPGMQVIAGFHWKWASFNPGDLRGTDNVEHLGARSDYRAGDFIAIHCGQMEELTEVKAALNQHGFPNERPVFIEHEHDETVALTLDDARSGLNAVAEAGIFAHRYLVFPSPSGGHQEAMTGTNTAE